MRLYVASSFTNARFVQVVADEAERRGHEVPDKWWGINADREAGIDSDAEWHGNPEIRALAARHWRTIKGADALVLVGNHCDSDNRLKFTGGNVEVGYALALGKPVVIIGRVKRSAMYADCIFARTVVDAMRMLACIDGEDRSGIGPEAPGAV